MDLQAYFTRIGHDGALAPDRATLTALMRAHLAAMPFENLDVQLGRPVSLDPDAIFDKLVTRRRGGWCYEQNGLFGRVLAALGYDVRRISAGVMRHVIGEASLGNHLALLVTLEGRSWLVDVGFGGTQAGPLPLAPGEDAQAPYVVAVRETEGWWRFEERYGEGKPFSYDFTTAPADEALFARRCAELQADPESPFVQNLVVQQRRGDTHRTLRGRVLITRGPAGETRELLQNAEALIERLDQRFGLTVPEAAGLWDAICARHAALFPDD
ncbi:arylamine N-acetyltransferase family protein [Sphingomonas kyeonggiensis]|uniref:N-hydroxyarylamine O-acetyltransferase n=1 Tax=Sphingomonas kyeonggiensis TaxID=1268553 RepID=A0A7W6JQE4_9SPHN|nr:arylamine N-acetyltransferase [Sphingomonas kyeonggiensis]MBB4096587.1 N-hydroxyarylamine O-acetyltransferase [Sphingomonas kyeonggiensis]